jgi:hypothetical protein
MPLLGSAFIQDSKSEPDAADLKMVLILQVNPINALIVDHGPSQAAEVNQHESIPALLRGAGLDRLNLKSTVASRDVEVVKHEIAVTAAAECHARGALRQDQGPTSILSGFDFRDCYRSSS